MKGVARGLRRTACPWVRSALADVPFARSVYELGQPGLYQSPSDDTSAGRKYIQYRH